MSVWLNEILIDCRFAQGLALVCVLTRYFVYWYPIMMFQEPTQTAYDLNFRLFGFEVRTNPFFFVLPVLIGQSFIGNLNPGLALLAITLVLWISVLVHELGHTFAFRYFRIDSWIWLYWMGGLAIPGSGSRSNRMFSSFGSGYGRSLTPNQQIIVSLAGPVAGLLLAAVFCLLAVALGAEVKWAAIMPVPVFPQEQVSMGMVLLQRALTAGVVINVVLNLFNLLPVHPLDGGQIARQIMIKSDAWDGVRKSLILSIVVAIGAALLSFKIFGSQFGVFYFGLMAYFNFQELQGSRW